MDGRLGHVPEQQDERQRHEGAGHAELAQAAQRRPGHVRVQYAGAQHKVEEHAGAAAQDVRRHVTGVQRHGHGGRAQRYSAQKPSEALQRQLKV